MKLSDFLKSPSSFRAQMVAFIALMLALTMAVISFYNQRLEERTTHEGRPGTTYRCECLDPRPSR